MSKRTLSRATRQAHQRAVNARRVDMARIAARVDSGEIRRPNYVHEGDLTDTQRGDIGNALETILFQWQANEVPYTSDIEVAYHAGFLLTASWLLFGATEVPELGAVFERHRIDVHHDWWTSDGWGDYHEKWKVTCPSCEAINYGRPDGWRSELASATWPESCHCCNAAMPTPHHTEVIGGEGKFWADCSCGWSTDQAMGERSAKGQATRHVNHASAA